MTPETVRETIRNYQYYLNDFKQLQESLGKSDADGAFNMLGIGLSSREERIARRLEELERRLLTVMQAIDSADLTDREWTMVDSAMDGKSMRWVGKNIFNLSHSTSARILESAVLKIVDCINSNHAY